MSKFGRFFRKMPEKPESLGLVIAMLGQTMKFWSATLEVFSGSFTFPTIPIIRIFPVYSEDTLHQHASTAEKGR